MPDAVPLAAGHAEADVLALDQPLSFWGGVDAETGAIIDTHHPQRGASITGRILVMPAGRGSSSSSSVLAETLRAGVGPAGLVLGTPDPILATGALVADALYDVRIPIVVADPTTYTACAGARRLRLEASDTGAAIEIEEAGPSPAG